MNKLPLIAAATFNPSRLNALQPLTPGCRLITCIMAFTPLLAVKQQQRL